MPINNYMCQVGTPDTTFNFRYDSTCQYNYSQEWLETGWALSCVTPVIKDFDLDGDNELFSGGLYAGGGCTWLYEGIGFGQGYVSYVDTLNTINGPNEAEFGIIDYYPSVALMHILPNSPDDSKISLWSFTDNGLEYMWLSELIDTMAAHSPEIKDPDNDGKKNIIIAGNELHKAMDFEQISAGIETR